MTSAARLQRYRRILRNPSLYPGVATALGPDFPWHTHAASPRSSQALCLSAWAPLGALEVRHAVVDSLVRECLPGAAGPSAGAPAGGAAPAAARRWRLSLEVSEPAVLHERGARATAVDVLLETDDAVVAVESKFLRDALRGFRGCGEFPARCRGFYGPGSDRSGTDAPCRLAVSEGRREARAYWGLAAGLFRPELLVPGPGEPGSCPLHRHHQLARTLLFAAGLARADPRAAEGLGGPAQGGREIRPGRDFGALVIAPAATAGELERQTAGFASGVLLPWHAGRVAVVHYERLAALLQASGDREAAAVGAFVAALLPRAPGPDGDGARPDGGTAWPDAAPAATAPAPDGRAAWPAPASAAPGRTTPPAAAPPRTETARDLRRRAEAERRAQRRAAPRGRVQ